MSKRGKFLSLILKFYLYVVVQVARITPLILTDMRYYMGIENSYLLLSIFKYNNFDRFNHGNVKLLGHDWLLCAAQVNSSG